MVSVHFPEHIFLNEFFLKPRFPENELPEWLTRKLFSENTIFRELFSQEFVSRMYLNELLCTHI